jgi:phage tail sheath gpL-like
MPIRMPKINVEIVPSARNVDNEDQKILFMGHVASPVWPVAPGVLYTNIPNDGQEDFLFGSRSQLACMIRAAKAINKDTRMDAIPLTDNPSGSAAEGQVVFTGTTVHYYCKYTVIIGSAKNHTYILDATPTTTPSQLADMLVLKITYDTSCPFTAYHNVPGYVLIRSANKGTSANYHTFSVSVDEPRALVTIGACVAITGGAGDSNIQASYIISQITNTRYQTIVVPYPYLAVMQTVMAGRWEIPNQIMDGVIITCKHDTYNNWIGALSGQNDKQLVIIPLKTVATADTVHTYRSYGSNVYEMPEVIASEVAAIRALRLTDGAVISNYTINTRGAKDGYGGSAIASLPYFNTPIYDLSPIKANEEWTYDEVDDFVEQGGSVVGNSPNAQNIIMGQMITTYKTDINNEQDVTFKYLEYVDTISQIREYFFRNLRARFAQCRLTEGEVIPGRNMANSQTISSYLNGLYNDLASDDYVLVQGGETALNFFKDNKSIEIDMETGTVSVYMVIPIVTQIRQINASIQIAFSING